ncbi:DUF1772 domain-containing protein [Agromyces atrinae]|uniref:anthrone oxygenase family protein n=1 Tax=Agromyces atrinae TaxID=592376 RepID=UPI001F5A3545|nr:anthrone oxygenase family protein [Agromyces atrinae]MCI2957270.1 DUF1772 domain-containing protein [Agromyces atrinae]
MDFAIALAALGTALVGGIFFAFSGFVMSGLDRLDPDDAGRAMRGINVAAVGPALLVALGGTALLVLGLTVWAFLPWTPASPWLVAAGILYLGGVGVVTGAANVPRNDRLEAGSLDWARYRPGWNAWNHVRTASGVLAGACYLAALLG